MAVEHAMFKFEGLKVNSHYDRQTDRMKSTKCRPSPHFKMACCMHYKKRSSRDTMRNETVNKVCTEQKGVAQLLQIEEVRLNSLYIARV